VLAGVLLALLIGTNAPAAAADSCDGTFTDRLDCLADQAGAKGGPDVVATIKKPLHLVAAEKRDLELAQNNPAAAPGTLVVEVPGKGETGAGGTVLLVLAEKRRVSPESMITRLDDGYVEQLRKAGACKVKKLCDLVGKKNVRGRDLIKEHLAVKLEPADTSNPLVTSLLIAAGAVLLLLTVLLGLAVRRSRSAHDPGAPVGPVPPADGPPSPPPGPRPHTDLPIRPPVPAQAHSGTGAPGRHRRPGKPVGPIRQAVVRTVLHPQGYVEVDHCLRRAVWTDPAVPPPAPGDLVDVMDDARGRDPAVLLAFPPHEGRRISGEVHAQ
jgi:hypothetical protein